jgi:predicted enzyme related to lactoylglutathione lyase
MAAAETFYRDLLGWNYAAGDAMPMPYRFIQAGDKAIGGIMNPGPGDGADWQGCVTVAEVDAATGLAQSLGAEILMPPGDIPGGFGRIATIRDPGGAVLSLVSDDDSSETTLHNPHTPGFCGWHELTSNAPAASLAFFSALLDWQPGEVFSMGETGDYQLFLRDGQPLGGICPPAPGSGGPRWNYYFTVPDIRVAMETLQRHGITRCFGPMQVPGGSWIVMTADPQGAPLCLISPVG